MKHRCSLVRVTGTQYSQPLSPLPASAFTLPLVYFKIDVSERGSGVDDTAPLLTA